MRGVKFTMVLEQGVKIRLSFLGFLSVDKKSITVTMVLEQGDKTSLRLLCFFSGFVSVGQKQAYVYCGFVSVGQNSLTFTRLFKVS